MEEKTLKQLQTELTAKGFVGAEFLTTKKQVETVLHNLTTKEAPAVPAEDNVPKVTDDTKKDEKKYFGKAAAMKEHLESLPLVDFIIPLGFGEKKGSIETWEANGYRLNILKGARVRIPSQVADDLANAYNLTAEAGREFSADRDEKLKDALNI